MSEADRYCVMMTLGCPPLIGEREVLASNEPLSESEAHALEVELKECVGVGGIGVDSLTLIRVEMRRWPL